MLCDDFGGEILCCYVTHLFSCLGLLFLGLIILILIPITFLKVMSYLM